MFKSLTSFALFAAVVVAAPLAAREPASASSSIGDFGSCSVPQIEFGDAFDNRKETSFQPVDKGESNAPSFHLDCSIDSSFFFHLVASFDHSSADNIDIITQFVCDTLVNTCGADETAQQTCAQAKAAADTVTAKTGGQADGKRVSPPPQVDDLVESDHANFFP